MFRSNIDKIASATKFRSEHQMESFLYNNPEIIGILSDSSGVKEGSAIIQQFPTQKGTGGKGRIDLVALNSDKKSNLVLKIIELKKKAVKDDFLHLKEYREIRNSIVHYKRIDYKEAIRYEKLQKAILGYIFLVEELIYNHYYPKEQPLNI